MIVTANPAHAGRILVVDDQPANLRVVSTLLSRQGYEVDNAGDGPTALELCRQRAPDLVLLDMMMPGMDGFALIAQLKQHEELLRIPVVFLTAAHDRDLLLRAFDAGAVDYVTKPFTPEELLARVSAHIGLKLTRDRLERVAREREELVTLVAHDLKNPLTSVLFASDLLLANATRAERVPHYLQVIRDSAQDAIDYIHRYLEMQSLAAQARDAGSAEPQASGLGDAMQWLARRYEMQLEARGIRLSVRMPSEDARVAIDGLVLRQVAENLVTNAIKYAQSGGELDLSVRNGAQGYWQLIAQDRGPGISASRQRDLFKPFVRLDDSAGADPMSSGLGLSLARQIVANAGGQLWYEDRDGGGARFVIELPEARDAAE